jgi:N-acyl amino acid synthase FeeM
MSPSALAVSASAEPETVAVRKPQSAKRSANRSPDQLSFALACDTITLDAAFRLVHDQYVWRGFMTAAHRSGRRVNLRHALPSTRVFVARAGDRVIGTASVIQDSPLGLPMEEIFGAEIAMLRREGRRVAEISALAMDADRRAYGLPALIRLLRLVLVYAVDLAGLDDLCMVVRPQHAAFYLRLSACRTMGEPRDYPKVHIEGAVALRVDLHEIRALIAAFDAGTPPDSATAAFLCSVATREALLTQLRREVPASTMTADRFAYFFAGQEVLSEASAKDRAYVEGLYAPVDTGREPHAGHRHARVALVRDGFVRTAPTCGSTSVTQRHGAGVAVSSAQPATPIASRCVEPGSSRRVAEPCGEPTSSTAGGFDERFRTAADLAGLTHAPNHGREHRLGRTPQSSPTVGRGGVARRGDDRSARPGSGGNDSRPLHGTRREEALAA